MIKLYKFECVGHDGKDFTATIRAETKEEALSNSILDFQTVIVQLREKTYKNAWEQVLPE